MNDNNSEITIFGFTRSIHIMLICLVAFIGLCFVLVEVMLNPIYPTAIKALITSLTGFALFGVIFGVSRYFAEQIITYVTANFYAVTSLEDIEEENDAPEQK